MSGFAEGRGVALDEEPEMRWALGRIGMHGPWGSTEDEYTRM